MVEVLEPRETSSLGIPSHVDERNATSEPHGSPSATPQQLDLLEGQLRECFGRVAYSHKTHEKRADILLARLSLIKWSQIALSAVATTGFVVTLLGKEQLGAATGALMSTVLLALNAYTKSNDLGGLAQRHRDVGASLWAIRERYLSLLVDLRLGIEPIASIQRRRDELLADLHRVYASSPSAGGTAYKKAQQSLQQLEDLTFTDGEVDAFLPKELKRDKPLEKSVKRPD
jgi:hypothetical protein